MTATTNAENLRQHKIRFFLTGEQILAFASHTNTVTEVKNLSPNSKYCVTMFYIEHSHLVNKIHFIDKLSTVSIQIACI